jgi:hypothetical protein
VGVTVAQAGQGAEVARHALEGALAVTDARVEVLAEVVDDRPLVVRLGERRIELDGPVEMLERVLVIPAVEGLGATSNARPSG